MTRMFKLVPIALTLMYAFVLYQFSSWRTRRELDAKSTELADPKLRLVTDQIAKALDQDKVRVHIYEIDAVNGLAAPDGRIFITRGFYKKFQEGDISSEELGSVIAHELGHVALGHSRRRMVDFCGQNAIRTVLVILLSRILPGIGGWIANAITMLLAARLSRSDEYEADAYAAALLTKAKIGIEPQISLLKKLEELTQQRRGSAPAWLLSHPKTDDRVRTIETLAAQWQQ